MNHHHHFFDGSSRPGWAGPVTSVVRKKGRSASGARELEFAGVVLPIHVPARHLPTTRHGHTFGLGLGFPDLSQSLLDPDKREETSRRWKSIEQTISEAAAGLMDWSGKSDARSAGRSRLPEYALHMRLHGDQPGEAEEEESGGTAPHHFHRLVGELAKVFPIKDPGGMRHRLQTIGSPAEFMLDDFVAAFSRDPRRL